MSNPRDNSEAAYQAFMNMTATEWALLIKDLVSGGVLTPTEQTGFDRAIDDRAWRDEHARR